jgi:hypothetical protein
MVPIRVVHSCSSTTISKGGAWGRVSDWLYDETHQSFPHQALLAAPKGELPTSELRPVELPLLARPKGCFAYARSIDAAVGRTTGRLGYKFIQQARFSLCHRRAGTMILQLVSASDDQTKALISDYGAAWAAGARAQSPHPPEPQDRPTGLWAGGSSE